VTPDDGWREAHALLAARLADAPDAFLRSLALPWPALDLGAPRRLVATGVGSSEAHARFLAHVVDDVLPARFVPLGALTTPPAGADRALLVVFSQGVSPNARLVLAQAASWHRAVAVTAAPQAAVAGVQVVRCEGADEFGTLVRVLGPLAAYAAAIRLAAALGAPLACAPDALRGALDVAARAGAALPDDAFDPPLAFLVSGAHGSLTRNVQLKVLEGLLDPLPPVWELLHVGHGPFQQALPRPQRFLALTRADAPDEPALLARLDAMLDPATHPVLRLPATLPGALAILEHELATSVLLVRAIARRRLDQGRWPGRTADAPLYQLAAAPVTRRLDALTWPEVERLVARGTTTAIVPLGSVEQHGPHLPLGTDAWIADALAERLAARCDDALVCPTVAVGCAREHLGFPGTLDVDAATLEATLRDQLRALARHGIRRAFVFSAHGGNVAALRAMQPRLAAACAPLVVDAFTDLDGLTVRLHAVAAAHGVDAAAAGHHAGALETAMLLALRPGDVRRAALAAGRLVGDVDAQALFYPDLRANAPDGTVGDPRGADPAHGLVYLDAWVAVLAAAYRGEKNVAQTKSGQTP
jgi:creatinine amidohydrolase